MHGVTLGLSSYFLWTQKGLTNLPLVRGSGFIVPFSQVNGFFKFHIVTAAHVSCPVRYRQLYSSDASISALNAIGERHVSNRILIPQRHGPVKVESVPLRFQQHFMPNVDVSLLRVENEELILNNSLPVLEVDVTPLEDGEEIVLCGMECSEIPGNPNDDELSMIPRQLHAVCKAALVSVDYGTVLLGELIDPPSDDFLLPVSMCGGPVLRKSNGKVVGVIVSRVTRGAVPQDMSRPMKHCDPFLDVSDNTDVLQRWPFHVAFVPFAEFEGAMRRSES